MAWQTGSGKNRLSQYLVVIWLALRADAAESPPPSSVRTIGHCQNNAYGHCQNNAYSLYPLEGYCAGLVGHFGRSSIEAKHPYQAIPRERAFPPVAHRVGSGARDLATGHARLLGTNEQQNPYDRFKTERAP
jgi:hypothetical protein